MAERKSSNTHVHSIRDGYSPKSDGPKVPPKGGSATGGWSTRDGGSVFGVTKKPNSKQ
jgi:hypothetical protein